MAGPAPDHSPRYVPRAFPVEQLRAVDGDLDAAVRWGEAQGDEPVLLYRLNMHLAPLQLDERLEPEPRLRLHSVRFGIKSWRELEGTKHPFRHVVLQIAEDGEEHPVYDAYGTLKLGESYHEVVPSLVEFGPRAGCTIDARVEGLLRSAESPRSFGPSEFAVHCRVVLGDVRVVGNTASSQFPDLPTATELASHLLNVDDYEPPRVERGCTVLTPRC